MNKCYGSTCVCFIKEDLVIKRYHGWYWLNLMRPFYDLCLKNKYSILPKCYDINYETNEVRQELLHTFTEKCKRYIKQLNTVYDGILLKDRIIEGTYQSYINEENNEIVEWALKIKRIIKAHSLYTQWGELGDLELKNIGERSDGTIVFFDI